MILTFNIGFEGCQKFTLDLTFFMGTKELSFKNVFQFYPMQVLIKFMKRNFVVDLKENNVTLQ